MVEVGGSKEREINKGGQFVCMKRASLLPYIFFFTFKISFWTRILGKDLLSLQSSFLIFIHLVINVLTVFPESLVLRMLPSFPYDGLTCFQILIKHSLSAWEVHKAGCELAIAAWYDDHFMSGDPSPCTCVHSSSYTSQLALKEPYGDRSSQIHSPQTRTVLETVRLTSPYDVWPRNRPSCGQHTSNSWDGPNTLHQPFQWCIVHMFRSPRARNGLRARWPSESLL